MKSVISTLRFGSSGLRPPECLINDILLHCTASMKMKQMFNFLLRNTSTRLASRQPQMHTEHSQLQALNRRLNDAVQSCRRLPRWDKVPNKNTSDVSRGYPEPYIAPLNPFRLIYVPQAFRAMLPTVRSAMSGEQGLRFCSPCRNVLRL